MEGCLGRASHMPTGLRDCRVPAKSVWCAKCLVVPLLLRFHAQMCARFGKGDLVIPPFLTGPLSRIYAASFSFCLGVMPPIAILGRSLLYVQSQRVA